MTAWSIKQIQNGAHQFEVTTVDGRMYSRDILEWFLDLMARAIPVDETFYRRENQDVDEAVAKGEVISGAAHFIEHGFYEDRCPCDVQVDEEDYFARYPDVAEAVRAGAVASATVHWLKYGRFEGREAMLKLYHPSSARNGGLRQPNTKDQDRRRITKSTIREDIE